MAEDVADRPWLMSFFDVLVCTKYGFFCFLTKSRNPKWHVKNSCFEKLLSNFRAIFGDEILEPT